jgi:cysteinyl-tRNA synthetase
VLHGWRDHELLRRAFDVFGLASLAETDVSPPAVVELARARQVAREAGDFGEADRLREEIAGLGWEVRDVPGSFELFRSP